MRRSMVLGGRNWGWTPECFVLSTSRCFVTDTRNDKHFNVMFTLSLLMVANHGPELVSRHLTLPS